MKGDHGVFGSIHPVNPLTGGRTKKSTDTINWDCLKDGKKLKKTSNPAACAFGDIPNSSII